MWWEEGGRRLKQLRKREEVKIVKCDYLLPSGKWGNPATGSPRLAAGGKDDENDDDDDEEKGVIMTVSAAQILKPERYQEGQRANSGSILHFLQLCKQRCVN